MGRREMLPGNASEALPQNRQWKRLSKRQGKISTVTKDSLGEDEQLTMASSTPPPAAAAAAAAAGDGDHAKWGYGDYVDVDTGNCDGKFTSGTGPSSSSSSSSNRKQWQWPLLAHLRYVRDNVCQAASELKLATVDNAG